LKKEVEILIRLNAYLDMQLMLAKEIGHLETELGMLRRKKK